ncbi:4416_t:CDS:2 [Funneliformis geosporum]|uniref:17599_t:CDS:1 n=1 Tax=Funneliformis geosporum TaxID=1117311 RepID=A0A9W4SGI8_9GLOM|nr:17599_t:CDS:2 [Funneliformis geosporum]CAI2168265.1 4416_t:CDS:2 [Funneliformis geosporum]
MSTTNITSAELIIHSCLWDSCCEIFTSLPELTTHIATSHLITLPDNLTSFNCKWNSCRHYSFQSKYLLTQHIRNAHLLPIINNQMTYFPTQETFQGVSPYHGFEPTNNYPQRITQLYSNLIRQVNMQNMQNNLQSPHTYQIHKPPQLVQIPQTPSRSLAQTIDNDDLMRMNPGWISVNPAIQAQFGTSTEQFTPYRSQILPVQSLQPQFSQFSSNFPVQAQSLSSSSLGRIQNQMPQQFNAVVPSQIVNNYHSIQEKEDSPVQILSPNQNLQGQINNIDLKEEVEKLRKFIKDQTKELEDKSQALDKKNEEMKNMSCEIKEKSKEIIKLKSLVSLKDSEINIIKGDLELQTSISKLLQEQNKRSDDKLRRMWVEMLCRKADIEISNDRKNFEGNRQSRKRVKKNDDDKVEMELHPMEIPAPPHEKISIITNALMCDWEGCGKPFRTKLALRAHVVSSHMDEDIVKFKLINP